MKTPAVLALAGLLLLDSMPLRAADPLERLFFTPEKRAALERQRQLNIEETQTLEGNTLSLDGVVTRSSGKSTVWVSGRPQHDQATPTGVRADVAPAQPARATLRAGEEAPATLTVGETLNRATREKQSPLGDGRIDVKGAAARR